MRYPPSFFTVWAIDDNGKKHRAYYDKCQHVWFPCKKTWIGEWNAKPLSANIVEWKEIQHNTIAMQYKNTKKCCELKQDML